MNTHRRSPVEVRPETLCEGNSVVECHLAKVDVAGSNPVLRSPPASIEPVPYKDAEQRRKYAREWMARRRAEWFADKACVKCGTTERLRLDHIDPLLKVNHRIWSWSQARRDIELAKCQVLCDPCHQIKSIAQQPITHGWEAYTHGTRSMYGVHGCRCGLCQKWKSDYDRQQRPHRYKSMAP